MDDYNLKYELLELTDQAPYKKDETINLKVIEMNKLYEEGVQKLWEEHQENMTPYIITDIISFIKQVASQGRSTYSYAFPYKNVGSVSVKSYAHILKDNIEKYFNAKNIKVNGNTNQLSFSWKEK